MAKPAQPHVWFGKVLRLDFLNETLEVLEEGDAGRILSCPFTLIEGYKKGEGLIDLKKFSTKGIIPGTEVRIMLARSRKEVVGIAPLRYRKLP